MKKENNIFLWVVFGIVVVAVFLLPNAYSLISNLNKPKIEKGTTEKKEEVKVVTDEIIQDIHFPMMRNSKYSNATYYSLDTFKISDMSNADILYSAFKEVEDISINNKTLKSAYIDLRIKNTLGKNVIYKLERFYVPQDSNSKYKGYWNYNASNKTFVHQGGNKNENKSVEYYDLMQKIKAEYDKRDIVIYYYVGFAKVTGNKYTIYSDPKMTNVLKEGTKDNVDLNKVFESIDNKSKKVYKYTFKDTICSYSEYCLYEGKWINEL